MVLRIEDTDRSRAEESSLQSILEGIRWLGLTWDEGPDVGGPHAPYFQSERLGGYRVAVDRLLADGHAYYCFCTPERLAELRQEQQRRHEPPGYDRLCYRLPPDGVKRRLDAGDPPAAVRLLIPPGQTTVVDLLRGPSEYQNATLDDPIILKSDGFPTYHLAAIVDDHEMAITHIIRGTEWLPSFPKHKILYDALGWEPPLFVHVPTVLGPDKTKLSKRHGAAAVQEYRDQGYLSEAMVNFLAFLGWSPGTGEEFFTLEQLVAAFELEKVQVSPAVFDIAKLDSVNGLHIRGLPPDEFVRRLRPFVADLDDQLLTQAAPLVQERIQRLTDADALLRFLVDVPAELPRELVPKGRSAAETAEVLRQARAIFEAGDLDVDLEGSLRALAEKAGWKPRDLFMSLRVALTGKTVTPPLPESARLLGPTECLSRIDFALGHLERGRPG
jgi:glutamyl-tRNA synthetase